MLLNIPQCTGQLLPAEGHAAPNVGSAVGEKPWGGRLDID